MGFDFSSVIDSAYARSGLSITFIVAGILLLLVNLGIDISFSNISIKDIISPDYIAFVQIYIIIALFSLAYTILKNPFKKVYIAPDSSSPTCHNCNNPMNVSERKCVLCGSIFTYKDENK